MLENNINYIMEFQLKFLDEISRYDLYYSLIKWSKTKNKYNGRSCK